MIIYILCQWNIYSEYGWEMYTWIRLSKLYHEYVHLFLVYFFFNSSIINKRLCVIYDFATSQITKLRNPSPGKKYHFPSIWITQCERVIFYKHTPGRWAHPRYALENIPSDIQLNASWGNQYQTNVLRQINTKNYGYVS